MSGQGLSAVIPTFNGGRLLERCLDALEHAEAVEEVLVLDGGSSDGSPERAARRERVRVMSFPGTSFQWRLNHGVREASNEFILHLNDDAFVDPDTPARLLEVMHEDPRVACAGASLRFEDGRPQRSLGAHRTLMAETLTLFSLKRLTRLLPGSVPRRREAGVDHVAWLPLCAAVIRRSAYCAVGGFDERFSFYFDDIDFCRKLVESGWILTVRWDAGAIHVGGGSTSAADPTKWLVRFNESRLLYLRKYYPRGWRVYAALWRIRAVLQLVVWKLRAVGRGLRGQREAEVLANRWANAFKASLRAANGRSGS